MSTITQDSKISTRYPTQIQEFSYNIDDHSPIFYFAFKDSPQYALWKVLTE